MNKISILIYDTITNKPFAEKIMTDKGTAQNNAKAKEFLQYCRTVAKDTGMNTDTINAMGVDWNLIMQTMGVPMEFG